MATAKPTLMVQVDGEVRAATAEELTAIEAIQAEVAAAQAAKEAKATARASALAKLAELGLTEEEIQAL